MAVVTMIDLCKAILPRVYLERDDIIEIERLSAARYLVCDAAVTSRNRNGAIDYVSITVNAITAAGRALVSTFRGGVLPL